MGANPRGTAPTYNLVKFSRKKVPETIEFVYTRDRKYKFFDETQMILMMRTPVLDPPLNNLVTCLIVP